MIDKAISNERIPIVIVKVLLYTAAFNTVIAVLLTIVGFGASFRYTLLFSQCIGLTIALCVVSALHLFEKVRGWGRGVVFALALTTGAILGTLLGTAAVDLAAGSRMPAPVLQMQIVTISIIFGLVITYFFYARKSLAASARAIQEERIKRLSSEKQVLEADLKRLQAQIEPHFLFNTLSNIVSLMDQDPAKAKSMQMDLIRYLRTALQRTRNQVSTLGQEAELMQSYLNIFKIRMGERLQFSIDIPAALLDRPFAPMLLQPIVENALLHGLEPKIEGGAIHISACVQGNLLQLMVADTGKGLAAHQRLGLGLTNVQERLAHLFGSEGRLSIRENPPCGVMVVIEVPLDKTMRME